MEEVSLIDAGRRGSGGDDDDGAPIKPKASQKKPPHLARGFLPAEQPQEGILHY